MFHSDDGLDGIGDRLKELHTPMAEVVIFHRPGKLDETLYFIKDGYGDPATKAGPLLWSPEAYSSFDTERTYYLFEDGAIVYKAKAIGLVENLEFTGEMVQMPTPTEEGIANLKVKLKEKIAELFGPSPEEEYEQAGAVVLPDLTTLKSRMN